MMIDVRETLRPYLKRTLNYADIATHNRKDTCLPLKVELNSKILSERMAKFAVNIGAFLSKTLMDTQRDFIEPSRWSPHLPYRRSESHYDGIARIFLLIHRIEIGTLV